MTFKRLNKTCACLANKVRSCMKPAECPRQITPLSHSNRSGRIRICKITGDRKLCARMASLGVHPGEEAELLCPENGSSCLLKLQGGTLSLDTSATRNILVTEI